MQRRRPRPVAETGRSCWGSGLQDASAAQGTKQTQGAATRRLPRLESSGDLAALNTRHLLRKPVCGLKAPLGLSCPAGTAVLSGSLLQPKENVLGGNAFCKSHRTCPTRKRSARETSQQAHLLALVLGADQRTGGGQAAHAVAVGLASSKLSAGTTEAMVWFFFRVTTATP